MSCTTVAIEQTSAGAYMTNSIVSSSSTDIAESSRISPRQALPLETFRIKGGQKWADLVEDAPDDDDSYDSTSIEESSHQRAGSSDTVDSGSLCGVSDCDFVQHQESGIRTPSSMASDVDMTEFTQSYFDSLSLPSAETQIMSSMTSQEMIANSMQCIMMPVVAWEDPWHSASHTADIGDTSSLSPDFCEGVRIAQAAARIHQSTLDATSALPQNDFAEDEPQEQKEVALSGTDFPTLFAKEFEKHAKKNTQLSANDSLSENKQHVLGAGDSDSVSTGMQTCDGSSDSAISPCSSTQMYSSGCFVLQYVWMPDGATNDASGCMSPVWMAETCENWYESPEATWLQQSVSRHDHPHSHANVPRYTDFSQNQQLSTSEQQGEVTTFMMHNVPNDYTRTTLIDVLDDTGLYGKVDLLHLPIDRSTKQNVGYAFINFINEEAANEGLQLLTGCEMSRMRMRKNGAASKKQRAQTIWLSPAHLQGLRANVEHYRNTSSKPLVRINGRWTDVLPSADSW